MATYPSYGGAAKSSDMTPVVKKKVVIRKPTGSTTSTASFDDIAAAARARAQATLNATISPISAQANRDATAITGAAGGLAQILGPVSDQIKKIYGDNAVAQANLGAGYSQALQNLLAADDASTQSKLAELGLPANPAAPVQAVGDVVGGLGGVMPSATLDQQGKAFASAAALLPATTRMQGNVDAAEARRQAAQKITALRAQYPDLYYKALQDERSWRNTQYDNYINYLNASRGTSGAKPHIAYGKDGTVYTVDPYTGQVTPTGQIYVPPPKPPAGGTPKQKAVAKRNEAIDTLTEDANTWLYRRRQQQQTILTGLYDSNGAPIRRKVAKPLLYREAFNHLFNQYWQKMRRFGYSKTDVRHAVNHFLAGEGFTIPGNKAATASVTGRDSPQDTRS